MNSCLWCGLEVKPEIRLADVIRFLPIKKAPLCNQCKSRCISLQSVKTCKGCGRRWEKEELCGDCIRWKGVYPEYLFHNTALYEYNSFLKEWMDKYKFQGDYRLRELFARTLKDEIRKRNQTDCLIVPIPISQKSMAARGFNQVSGILNTAQVSYEDILTHVGTGPKQSTKDRKQRMTSPQPFEILIGKKEKVENQRILLVDDIYTTGRTLFHAAECLFAHGAKEVCSITIAR